MASNINTTDIDAEYPVAGQDNDSQGFRDNFSTIKDNFIAAAAEIETLQSDTAKKNALNDFSGNTITNASFTKNTEEVYNAGNVQNNQNISFDNGHYQTLTVANDLTLTFSEWPATGELGKIRVVVRGDTTERTITWSSESAGVLKYDADFPSPFTVTSDTNPKIIDVWTDDGGLVVYMKYVGEFS